MQSGPSRDAGLWVGGYHFARPDTHVRLGMADARKEASSFLERLSFEPGDLPPALDVERGRRGLDALATLSSSCAGLSSNLRANAPRCELRIGEDGPQVCCEADVGGLLKTRPTGLNYIVSVDVTGKLSGCVGAGDPQGGDGP